MLLQRRVIATSVLFHSRTFASQGVGGLIQPQRDDEGSRLTIETTETDVIKNAGTFVASAASEMRCPDVILSHFVGILSAFDTVLATR